MSTTRIRHRRKTSSPACRASGSRHGRRRRHRAARSPTRWSQPRRARRRSATSRRGARDGRARTVRVEAGASRPTCPTRPMSTGCSQTAQETLGGLDALINNAGIAGPTGGVDEIVAGRLAALHRHRPDRPVPVRPPRRADAQGGGRRLDRQHVVGGRPARLCLPHALFGGEVRRHRLHPEPRQGTRAARHPRQRHPARHRRGAAHRRRHPRPRQAGRRHLRGDGEALSRRTSRCAAW